MALRIAGRRATSGWSLAGIAIKSRRLYSSAGNATYFSVELSAETKTLSSALDAIKAKTNLSNPHHHDAAIILTTPRFARCLEDKAFVSDFVSFLSGSEKPDRFYLLSAVVDHLAPPVPKNSPFRGLSILRSHRDAILPELWSPGLPKAREDIDKVAALTFELGSPRLTLPLANTTFKNHRTSTLLVSRFDLSQGTPRLEEQIEKHSQSVILPTRRPAQSIRDVGLWAPLVPLTHPRIVTESFGNIVRRVSVDDDSVPASMELESAVDEIFKKRSNLAQTPMGVWAMITPPLFSPNGTDISGASDPDPDATFNEKRNIEELVSSTASRLKELYGQGGRLYQILSGGGGWGAKKGLLSLDPQRTHFALSEEEEMHRFMQAMDGGNFVPVGSKIQFFTAPEASSAARPEPSAGVVFGTVSASTPRSDATDTTIIENHFGALSNHGVFVASTNHSPEEDTPGFNNEWKLNVPNSRIYL